MSDQPDRFLRPWQKITIGATVAVSFVAVFVLFSGKMNFISHHKEAQAQPLNVAKDYADAPLNYPKTASAPTVAPPARPIYTGNGSATSAAFSTGVNQDRLEALNSPIQGFSGGSRSSTSTATPEDSGKPPPGSSDALEASLQPTTMEGTRVAELPNPRWLIEEGRILSCTQATKINSTLPGGVTAIIDEDIRGETGDVPLLDKGTKVIGTIQHTLMNGADRLAVLWQDLTTPVLYDARGMPHQFRIKVNSPASDELGQAGVAGDLNRHLGIKIGSILGYSLIQGGTQYLIASQEAKSSGTQINLNSFQQGGNQAAEALLNAWVNIPDVMTRDQGLPCGIFVMRDLDMRAAYQLRRTLRR